MYSAVLTFAGRFNDKFEPDVERKSIFEREVQLAVMDLHQQLITYKRKEKNVKKVLNIQKAFTHV